MAPPLYTFLTHNPAEALRSMSVLRIRDVYPGSRIRIFSIPDPGSRVKKIPDPGSASKT
jgi:hypothetical protein